MSGDPLIDEPVVVGVDGVDWDALNAANAGQNIAEVSPEEEARQAELRRALFTYPEAESYFFMVDLSQELEETRQTKEVIETTGLARVFACFRPRLRLEADLREDRDLIFAISRVKYDSRIAEHEIILKTIYKSLMRTNQCR